MHVHIHSFDIEKPVRHVVYQHDIVCMYKILSLILWDIIMNEQLINIIWTNMWASVFSGSRINGSRMDGSCGFTISRLYDNITSILLIIRTYLCVCVSVCICDILWLTRTFLHHRLDCYSLQHFSHRLPMQSWLMSLSPPLQDKNLY